MELTPHSYKIKEDTLYLARMTITRLHLKLSQLLQELAEQDATIAELRADVAAQDRQILRLSRRR